MATLFLSSSHHTIIKLFSIGHTSADNTGCLQPEGALRRTLLNTWSDSALFGGAGKKAAARAARALASAAAAAGVEGGGLEAVTQRALLVSTTLQESPYTKVRASVNHRGRDTQGLLQWVIAQACLLHADNSIPCASMPTAQG